MTMTRKCTCGNDYGLWRLRCPACGTTNDQWTDANARATTLAFHARERQVRNECIACHNGGAKETCPHCSEHIHRNCKGMHLEDCRKFQVERERILRDTIVRGVHDLARKNILEDPAGTSQRVRDLLKGGQ